MPPQTVQDLALAKQDHQKATANMRDAETNWKRLKEEVDVLLDKVWSSEKECAELEKEHNPRWQDSQTAQISSQLSFHGGPQTMSQGLSSKPIAHHTATTLTSTEVIRSPTDLLSSSILQLYQATAWPGTALSAGEIFFISWIKLPTPSASPATLATSPAADGNSPPLRGDGNFRLGVYSCLLCCN
ncbi:hypothetical protein QC761_0113580 [Podospora bellae-mahoneyi]|uniref:Uncharacterized protein n=1 Tax=Podospora bellae-mahoneyi TaxID=2093777 RepID=A0ABR0F9H7_9PEZI|nr:hypothetical protein QC761_0113580 [Podospora bellae-mahoneyi]